MTLLQTTPPVNPNSKVTLSYIDSVFIHNLAQWEIEEKMATIGWTGPTPVARDLHLMWDSQRYFVAAGENALLGYSLIKKDFGDSRALANPQTLLDSVNRKEFIPSRMGEVRRLRGMYNQAFGDYLGDDDGKNAFEQHHIPHIYMYHASGLGPGERIYTVLEDPLGRSVIPVTSTAMDNQELKRMVMEQAETIKALLAATGLDPRSSPVSATQMAPVKLADGQGRPLVMDPNSGHISQKPPPANPNPTKKSEIPTVQ